MELVELILIWAIIVTIILGIIVGFLIKLRKKHDQDIGFKEDEIVGLAQKLGIRQSRAFNAGKITTVGDYTQILGEFSLLSKYDHIITLSTTSRQPSLDLIGVNNDTIDFLEIKKKGANLSKNESHIKKLVDAKKVSYKIYEIELPKNFSMNERTENEQSQKEDTKKEHRPIKFIKKIIKKDSYIAKQKEIYSSAYERWTKEDDEFLEKFWNDNSNKQNKDELVRELSKRFKRNIGGIKARLGKLGVVESRKCSSCGHEVRQHHQVSEQAGFECDGDNGSCHCKSFKE